MKGKQPRVVAASPAHPPDSVLEDAAAVLEAGGVVALPTETFYGLAADGLSAPSLARINGLKDKPPDAPVLLLLAEADQVERVSDRPPPLFRSLAERFWPGPLTLVIPARAGLPVQVAHGGTVAVRVPGLALPRKLAERLGRPISGVSANRSGEPPCRRATEVARVFAASLDMIVDCGASAGGGPSTILDLTCHPPRVVREGILPLSALRPFLPRGQL